MIKNWKFNKENSVYYLIGGIILFGLIKNGIKNIFTPDPLPAPIPPIIDPITPNFNIQDLKPWIDKKVYAKYTGVKLRTLAKSNAPIKRQYNTSQYIGYVYSAVSEDLGTKKKVWFLIMDNLNGAIVGYVPMDDVSLRPVNGHFID